MNLAVTAQHLLPKRLLTQLAGWLARRPGPHAPFLIRRFIARYKVDMSEAANPDIASYATFNDFFARALREGARPLAQADWVCPADGVISQLGPIQLGQLIQAKGHHYSATALLACSMAGTSPPSTSARAITTASTCLARGGCGR